MQLGGRLRAWLQNALFVSCLEVAFLVSPFCNIKDTILLRGKPYGYLITAIRPIFLFSGLTELGGGFTLGSSAGGHK